MRRKKTRFFRQIKLGNDTVTPHQGIPLARLLYLAIAGLFLSLSGPTIAQTDGWQSRCEGDYCAFRKTLIYADSGDPFALLEVLISTVDGTSAFVVTAPLGTELEPGIRLLTKGGDWRGRFKTCLPDGCRASVTLTADELTLLLENDAIEIRYFRFGEAQPVSARLPLNGLVASMSNGSK